MTELEEIEMKRGMVASNVKKSRLAGSTQEPFKKP